MAAHRLFCANCFLCLILFVRTSKWHESVSFRVGEGFVAKHVMEHKRVVDNIPLMSILKEFSKVQEYPYFINKTDLTKNTRSIHTFIVTKNLTVFKNDLIKAYKSSSRIDIKNLKVGVINFNITFDIDICKYKVIENTCVYSYQGTIYLGSRWTKTYNLREINHLSKVTLPDESVKECEMPLFLLPLGTCENEKTSGKRRAKSTP